MAAAAKTKRNANAAQADKNQEPEDVQEIGESPTNGRNQPQPQNAGSSDHATRWVSFELSAKSHSYQTGLGS